MMTIIMESTFNILPEKTKKELLETGTVKETKNGIKYIVSNE